MDHGFALEGKHHFGRLNALRLHPDSNPGLVPSPGHHHGKAGKEPGEMTRYSVQ